MIIEIALIIAAVIAGGIAVERHGSLSAALASAKKEAALIETTAAGIEGRLKVDIVADFAAIASRLRSL